MTAENTPKTNEITPVGREIHTLIENLVDVGATWARYGLTVGREALQTSAKTLTATSELLGEVSKHFETESRPTSGGN